MGQWTVDDKSKPGVIKLLLKGTFTVPEMQAFHAAHNGAIDACAGAEYRVFVDIRELAPFSPPCAEIMAQCKAYSSSRPNFRGSAVWVAASKIVAMQHRRTSDQTGVLGTELISEDEGELWVHLSRVQRSPQ